MINPSPGNLVLLPGNEWRRRRAVRTVKPGLGEPGFFDACHETVLSASTEWGDERGRRAILLGEVYRRHAVESVGENGDRVYRDTVPDAWVNTQSARRGEARRVHNVDDFRFQIHEI